MGMTNGLRSIFKPTNMYTKNKIIKIGQAVSEVFWYTVKREFYILEKVNLYD